MTSSHLSIHQLTISTHTHTHISFPLRHHIYKSWAGINIHTSGLHQECVTLQAVQIIERMERIMVLVTQMRSLIHDGDINWWQQRGRKQIFGIWDYNSWMTGISWYYHTNCDLFYLQKVPPVSDKSFFCFLCISTYLFIIFTIICVRARLATRCYWDGFYGNPHNVNKLPISPLWLIVLFRIDIFINTSSQAKLPLINRASCHCHSIPLKQAPLSHCTWLTLGKRF